MGVSLGGISDSLELVAGSVRLGVEGAGVSDAGSSGDLSLLSNSREHGGRRDDIKN